MVKFLWQSQHPTESETGWAWLPTGFLWAFNFVPESPCGSNNHSIDTLLSARADGLLLHSNQFQLSNDSPSVQFLGEAAIQFSIATKKNVPTGVKFDQIFKSKTLVKAYSLERYLSFEYQTWNDGLTVVHRPPPLTLRSRTGASKPGQHVGQFLTPAISPFLVSSSQPKHIHLFGLSTNVFSVKIGRTTALLWLLKVINFRRSRFVCTLSPCPVFGMCAARPAMHLTTPVCPVARTQTMILQVVYYKDSDFFKVARNEVENVSFAQRSAHRDSRIWRPELIEPAAERKWRARGRRPTFKSAYPDPQILPQCNILSNYPYNVLFFWVSRLRSFILGKKIGNTFGQILRNSRKCVKTWVIDIVNWSQKHFGILPSSIWNVFLKFFLQMNPIPMRKKQLLSISSVRF